MTTSTYDLIAIGGGTAGLVSGAGAAYLGMRAAIVEKAALGGDCLWTGCVPSKALIASARAAHTAGSGAALGLSTTSGPHDFPTVMARMRAARAKVAVHDDPERFRAMGVDIHLGTAQFVGPRRIEVEGIGILEAKRIVIATGATPSVPPIPGLAEAGYLTNETAFENDDLPPSILMLGAGPVGLELAQVYNRLGAAVTVLEMEARILPGEDSEAADVVRTALEAEGIRFVLGERAERVEVGSNKKIVVTSAGQRLSCDQIFVATGRRPATESLALDCGGVETDQGAVRVNQKLATTAKGVWAAGDVIAGPMFTHVADYQAKAVLQNSIFPLKKRVDYSRIPRVTYTDPELAQVGMGPEEALAHGATESRYDFRDLDRAITDGDMTGFVRIWTGKKGRILGATIVGSSAGELILPLVLAMENDISLPRISQTVFPYPTRVEGVKRAADAYRKAQLADSPTGALLRRVVSWLT